MTKSFAKETDDEEELPAQRSGGKRYITLEGFKKLEAELTRFLKVERPKITNEVAWAAAQGDRSENAEYIYGKKKLREIDRRIRYLEKLLDRLTIVRPSRAQAGRVFFGAKVTVEDDDGEQNTYRIVGPDEFDVKAGKISVESPLAKALLGKREGDEVVVVRPKGRVEICIVGIKYEDADR